jgi:hypothetical protein
MTDEISIRTERALGRLEGVRLMTYSDPRGEPISLPHQIALAELVSGEFDRDLASTFVHNLSWLEAIHPDESHAGRVIVGTTSGPCRALALRRQVSSWSESYVYPGLSPATLRDSARRIERLAQTGLLEAVSAPGPKNWLYQMPDWLWEALLDVMNRAAQRQA